MKREYLLRLIIPVVGVSSLTILTLLYIIDFKDYYRVLATLGVPVPSYPFIDWEFIGASVKCWSQGIDVYVADPCDVINRVYDYSPLWLRVIFIPADRIWTNPIGIGMVLGFVFSLFWLVRPANWGEAIVFVMACTSTVVLFCLERGNVDVIIFIMMVVAGVLSTKRLGIRLLSYGIILLAGLLKFYPLIAFWTAFRERQRTFLLIAGVAGFIVIAFYIKFREEMIVAWRNIPHVGFGATDLPFGAPAMVTRLFPGLQALERVAFLPYALMGILLILTVIQVIRLVREGGLGAAFGAMPEQAAVFLVIGAALMAGCFFAGQSVGYRAVHFIFVVAGLVVMRRTASDDTATRAMLAWTTAMVIFLMWEPAIRPAGPEDISSLALWRYTLFWFIDQLIWWRVMAVLLAILAIFTARSEFVSTLRLRGELFEVLKPVTLKRN
jgi:hypothetical protein